ncbi:MAG: DUF4250 domain-containing protein [Lachnospirales bacterium]
MIPKDPVMLLSFVNMKLRDEYDCLDSLCISLGVERDHIERSLGNINYEYDDSLNQFK